MYNRLDFVSCCFPSQPIIDVFQATSTVSSLVNKHAMEPIDDKAENAEEEERPPTIVEGQLGAEIALALEGKEEKTIEDTSAQTTPTPTVFSSSTPPSSAVSSSQEAEPSPSALVKQVAASEGQPLELGDQPTSASPSLPRISVSSGLEEEILAAFKERESLSPKPTLLSTQNETAAAKEITPAQPSPGEVACHGCMCMSMQSFQGLVSLHACTCTLYVCVCLALVAPLRAYCTGKNRLGSMCPLSHSPE